MTPRNSISRLADCAPVPSPESWPLRQPPAVASHGTIHCETQTPLPLLHEPQHARDTVYAALRAKARRVGITMIKARAATYALRPRELDILGEDLSSLPPNYLVTAIAYIARNPTQYRWVGFGGEVPAINLKAAMLYARLARARARQRARRAA